LHEICNCRESEFLLGGKEKGQQCYDLWGSLINIRKKLIKMKKRQENMKGFKQIGWEYCV
jgi:hypothetical protein